MSTPDPWTIGGDDVPFEGLIRQPISPMRIDGGDVCEFGGIPRGVLGDEPSRPDHLYDGRDQRAEDPRSTMHMLT
jgi:hypothetical protein